MTKPNSRVPTVPGPGVVLPTYLRLRGVNGVWRSRLFGYTFQRMNRVDTLGTKTSLSDSATSIA